MRMRAPAADGARHAAHLRGLNLERVFAVVLQQERPFTRAELIHATGLSAPTVGSLVADLLRSGLLSDLGTGPSRGGRRPSFMQFNARHAFIGGIDLGATRVLLAVADLRGDVVARQVVPTPPGGPDVLLAAVAAELRALLDAAQVPRERLMAVGAAAPGIVDQDDGSVVAVNLAGWNRVPMAGILSGSLGVPVIVDNDVNLAVLGERGRGAARGHDTCAFLMFGTGIGAGIVVNGQLLHGHHFLAGEIALMCMGAEYVDRRYESAGCLEALAGLGSLAARWAPGLTSHCHEWIEEMFAAAASGDSRARLIVDEAATWIGMAVANVSVVLDPSLIVLGGPLILHAPALVDRVRSIVEHVVSRPSRIVVSELGDAAALSGTLLVAGTEARLRLRHGLRHVRVGH